jgi:hypothetical protein
MTKIEDAAAADKKKKTVEVKLCDDSTGQETVISVPAPEEDDEEEEEEMDVDTIAILALAIRKKRLRGQAEQDIRDAFPEFPKQYPILFGKCCDLDFSLEKLDCLLKQLDALRSNRYDKERATDKVMEELNRTYVDGVVEDLEKERKKSGGGGGDENENKNDNNKERLRRRLRDARNVRCNK